MNLTVSELGALLIIGFGLFYWLRIFATITAITGLVGVVLLGSAGWLGRVLTDVTVWVQHLAGTLFANVLGTVVTAGLFIALAIVYVHDVHPKHQTRPRTAWLGVALGSLIVAGVTGIPALSGVHSALVSAAGNVISIL